MEKALQVSWVVLGACGPGWDRKWDLKKNDVTMLGRPRLKEGSTKPHLFGGVTRVPASMWRGRQGPSGLWPGVYGLDQPRRGHHGP